MTQQTGYTGCGQRIHDHTDFVNCGACPVVGDTNLCERCLVWHIENLGQEIAEREIEIAAKRTEYEKFHTELEKHRFPRIDQDIK